MTTIQFAIGRLNLTTAAQQVVPARAGRIELRLFPINATQVYYGPDNTVSIQTGYPVNSQNALVERSLYTEAAVWAAGSGQIAWLELFNA